MYGSSCLPLKVLRSASYNFRLSSQNIYLSQNFKLVWLITWIFYIFVTETINEKKNVDTKILCTFFQLLPNTYTLCISIISSAL